MYVFAPLFVGLYNTGGGSWSYRHDFYGKSIKQPRHLIGDASTARNNERFGCRRSRD